MTILRSLGGFAMATTLAAFAVSFSFVQAQPPSCPSLETNVDYIGNDVGSARSADANGCCGICRAFNGCGAFTWSNYQGGTCWLKSSKGATRSSAGVRSAVVSSLVCSIEKDVDYVGNDIGNVRAPAEACCYTCRFTTGCMAYTWTNYQGGTCWLKSTRITKKIPSIGAISGAVPTILCSSTIDVDFVGNDIRSVNASFGGRCCGICGRTVGCSAYTWTNYNGGTCWLKSARGNVTKPNPSGLSGVILSPGTTIPV